MSSVQHSQQPQQPPRDSSNFAPNSGLTSPISPTNDRSNGSGANNKSGKTTGSSSSGRKLLSRLLPFRPMRAPPADFHIMPKWPYKVYAPGDTLEGWVVLATEKPIRITHLTVALHGYIRVYKNTPAVRDSVVPPTGPTGVQYHGNGYATLFQDEQVLSGEGKLERGRYRFAFTLLFPDRNLPSNIDFERGTICYDIVATLTRPTALGPTVQCNRPVSLSERIDVGTLRPPPSFHILLEPISKSRRSRRKKAPSMEKTTSFERQPSLPGNSIGEALADVEDAESIAPSATSEDPRPMRNSEQGDLRSETSVETGTASTGTGTGTGTAISYRLGESSTGGSVGGSGTPHVSVKAANVEKNTIRADLELMKGGYLPGDAITAKVSVQHIRRLKSMHGIIVTLFRQTRIETSPVAGWFDPNLSKEELMKMVAEDVLPKSKTGLAGLSLSSTSSVSVFRKDLRQIILPLLVNPDTLDSAVTVSIRIPEDAFPTIAHVPGQMLSFRYFLEIIVDLGGRLSNQFQSGATSSSALLTIPRTMASTDVNSQATQGNPMLAPVETSQLRREKGVVYHWFPLVIGTTDSSRDAARLAKEAAAHVQAEAEAQAQAQAQAQALDNQAQRSSTNGPSLVSQDESPNNWIPDQKRPIPPPHPSVGSSSMGSPPPINGDAPRYVPAPYMVDDSQLSEKERMRRQEQILLPSRPPVNDEPIDGPSSSMQPSAPPADNDIYDLEANYAAPSALPGSYAGPSAPTLEEVELPYDAPPLHPHAPSESASLYHPPPPAIPRNFHHPHRPISSRLPMHQFLFEAGRSSVNAEDKLELERLRLLGEASRPPNSPGDDAAGVDNAGESSSSTLLLPSALPPGPSAPPLHEPMAPVLDVHGGFDFGSVGSTNGPRDDIIRHHENHTDPSHEQLPAYEK